MKKALLALLGCAAGCSSFENDWKAARTDPADPLLGPWEGRWVSEQSSHSGGLRAVIRRRPDGLYETRYKARWGCCFSYSYTLAMVAEGTEGPRRFRGSADLGWLAGGVYEYEGEASGDTFRSTYRCKRDHGRFEMARPAPETPAGAGSAPAAKGVTGAQ